MEKQVIGIAYLGQWDVPGGNRLKLQPASLLHLQCSLGGQIALQVNLRAWQPDVIGRCSMGARSSHCRGSKSEATGLHKL